MKVKDLVDLLEDKDLPVVLDTGDLVTGIDSWRGIYSQLSLHYIQKEEDTDEGLTGTELVKKIEKLKETGVYGYKGGHYEVSDYTDIYVDNWGAYTETLIDSIDINEDEIVINTYQGKL